MREIAATLGYRSVGSVWYQLQELEAAGYIRKSEGRTRAFEIVASAEEELVDEPGSELVWVPKLNGRGEVDRLDRDVIPLPRQLVGEGSHFVLPVTGDAMAEAAIRSGDWVIVREQQTAEDGAMVVALHQGKPTVAVLQHRDGEAWLDPRNGHFSPVRDDHDQLLGTVVAVLRRV
jgi:repressor LexA